MKEKTKRLVIEVDEEIHALIKVKASEKKKSIRLLLMPVIMNWLKRN